MSDNRSWMRAYSGEHAGLEKLLVLAAVLGVLVAGGTLALFAARAPLIARLPL